MRNMTAFSFTEMYIEKKLGNAKSDQFFGPVQIWYKGIP